MLPFALQLKMSDEISLSFSLFVLSIKMEGKPSSRPRRRRHKFSSSGYR